MNRTALNMGATDAVMLHGMRPPNVMVAGSGSWLTDADGRRFLDFTQGWAVNSLGHAAAPVVRAVAEQLGALVNPGPAFFNIPATALCDRLRAASGLGGQVFLGCTGAEANEGAIKLVRKWATLHRPGAFEILTTHNGFHGRTLATMSASGKAGWEQLFSPSMPGFRKVAFGDLVAIEAAVTDATAAIMVEPFQGEAGVVVPPAGYLRGLRQIADRHGILLVFDEVQTGVGRTGLLFAFQHEDAQPDVLTVGKGLGGGLPLSALIARARACVFAPGEQGGTFSGNPVTAAAGLAVLDVVDDPAFLAGVRRKGARLAQSLVDVGSVLGACEVRGRGLLWALAAPGLDAHAVVAGARARGLLLNAPQASVLRFSPALNVEDHEIDQMAQTLAEVLRPTLQP